PARPKASAPPAPSTGQDRRRRPLTAATCGPLPMRRFGASGKGPAEPREEERAHSTTVCSCASRRRRGRLGTPAVPRCEGDSEQDVHEDVRHRLTARLALLALALLALGGPAANYLVWTLYAVSAPASLAFAAWCVAVRGRYRPVPLHAWTWRVGAAGAVHVAGLVAHSLLDPWCYGGAASAAWLSACRVLYGPAYLATVTNEYRTTCSC
ncbi:unnamed protein product, partial [Prorocentrum cordatum]